MKYTMNYFAFLTAPFSRNFYTQYANNITKHYILCTISYLDRHPLAFLGNINWLVVILNGCNPANINKIPLRNTNWSPNLCKIQFRWYQRPVCYALALIVLLRLCNNMNHRSHSNKIVLQLNFGTRSLLYIT